MKEHKTSIGMVVVPDDVPEHAAQGYLDRVVREAEASQADKRAKIQTWGRVVIGVITSVSSPIALFRFEDRMIAAVTAGIACFAFGIVTVEGIVKVFRARAGK